MFGLLSTTLRKRSIANCGEIMTLMQRFRRTATRRFGLSVPVEWEDSARIDAKRVTDQIDAA
jgi:hypothetical protein